MTTFKIPLSLPLEKGDLSFHSVISGLIRNPVFQLNRTVPFYFALAFTSSSSTSKTSVAPPGIIGGLP